MVVEAEEVFVLARKPVERSIPPEIFVSVTQLLRKHFRCDQFGRMLCIQSMIVTVEERLPVEAVEPLWRIVR